MSTFEIPKTCKGGVVVNEGPNFHIEVQDVPVPDIGKAFQQPTVMSNFVYLDEPSHVV